MSIELEIGIRLVRMSGGLISSYYWSNSFEPPLGLCKVTPCRRLVRDSFIEQNFTSSMSSLTLHFGDSAICDYAYTINVRLP
jgi:hypothetical protein